MSNLKEELRNFLSNLSKKSLKEPDYRQLAKQEKEREKQAERLRVERMAVEIRQIERHRKESGLDEYLEEIRKLIERPLSWGVSYKYDYPDGTNRRRIGVLGLGTGFHLPKTDPRPDLCYVSIFIKENGQISLSGRETTVINKDDWEDNKEIVGRALLDACKNPGPLPEAPIMSGYGQFRDGG